MIKKNAKSSTVTRLKGGSIIDVPPQTAAEELIPTINDRLRRINQAAADTRAIAQASPAGLQVQNNGALPASTQAALNLIPGANVTISSVANPDKKRTDVTISSASPPNTIEVDKAGVLVGTRGKLNFIVGANVTLTVADNVGTGAVDVTIAAAGGGSGNYFPISTPDFGTYTWLNQGGASYATVNGISVVNLPDDGGGAYNYRGLYKAIPGATYTVTVIICAANASVSANMMGAMFLHDTVSGHFIVFGISGASSGSTPALYITTETATNASGEVVKLSSTNLGTHGGIHGFRIVEDGVHRTYFFSQDGNAWLQVYQETTALFITPTSFGVLGSCHTGGTQVAQQISAYYVNP